MHQTNFHGHLVVPPRFGSCGAKVTCMSSLTDNGGPQNSSVASMRAWYTRYSINWIEAV